MNSVRDHCYSDGITKSRVVLLGPLPPPLGGVAVHIERVADKLKSQKNNVYHFNTVVEYRYWLVLWYCIYLFFWLLYKRPHWIVYHTMYVRNTMYDLLLLMVIKYLYSSSLLFVEHDCRHIYARSIPFKRWYERILQKVQVIFIGDSTKKSYDIVGIQYTHYSVESAFLPPMNQNVLSIHTVYPRDLLDFIAVHMPCILINAYQLVLLNDRDLYGIDASLEMIRSLVSLHPHSGLIIALATIGNASYFNQLTERIKRYRIKNHVYILTGQKVLWPLFQHVDLFVRPTLSDGSSVSVAEAIYFSIPTIASDVCVRPYGTQLFPAGNTLAFIDIVQKHFSKV